MRMGSQVRQTLVAVIPAIVACGQTNGGTPFVGGGPQNQAAPFLGQWDCSGGEQKECDDGSKPAANLSGTVTFSMSLTSSNDFVLTGSPIDCDGEIFTVSGDLASLPPGTTCVLMSKDGQGLDQSELLTFTQDTLTLLDANTVNQGIVGTDDVTGSAGTTVHCTLKAIMNCAKIH